MKIILVLLLLHIHCLYCKEFKFFNSLNQRGSSSNRNRNDNDNDRSSSVGNNDKYLSEITRFLNINANDRRLASRDELISTSLKVVSNVVIYFIVIKKFLKFFDDTIVGILKGSSSNKYNIPRNITKYINSNNTELNNYEIELCNGIVDPDSIDVDLSSLGGLSDIKDELVEVLEETSSFERYSSLLNPAKGILFYGMPGTGKTALARALCKAGNRPMITISPSLLLRKYVGETSQLVRAIFSLAFKIQPCILFIDEMDSLFRERYDDDNVVHRNLKTEFMALWDSVISSKCRITVIGATNRPQELDPAIQRRFERSYLIGIPDFKARKEIFKIVLRNTILEKDFDYHRCAELTENYTPSDIIAVCKAASYIPYRELKKTKKRKAYKRIDENPVIPTNLYEPINDNVNTTTSNTSSDLRPLRTSDIEDAVSNVYPTAWASKSYGMLTKQNPNDYWGNDNYNNNNRTPDYDNNNDNDDDDT